MAMHDALGHEAGDALLVTIADRLRLAVRDGDTPERLGGDELAVLLEGAGAEVAEAGAAVTASAGVATAVAGDTADDLLRRADAALYAAKRAGKTAISSPPGDRCTALLSTARVIRVMFRLFSKRRSASPLAMWANRDDLLAGWDGPPAVLTLQ